MSEALNPMAAGQGSEGAPIAAQAVETNSAPTTEPMQQVSDQPLTFTTRADFDKAVDERLAAIKQDWLNESYQNSQSMNDKFAAAVNAKLSQLQQLGIKADQVQAAKLVKAEQEQQRRMQSEQRQSAVDPGYQEFLGRFGVRNGNDVRLRDAYGLEAEYGIKLEKGDVEYQKYFADPKKEYSVFGFGRAYERALNEKKLRLGSEKTEPAQGANPAALPFLSGSGARSNIVENKTPSDQLLAQGAEEMRQKFSKNW